MTTKKRVALDAHKFASIKIRFGDRDWMILYPQPKGSKTNRGITREDQIEIQSFGCLGARFEASNHIEIYIESE